MRVCSLSINPDTLTLTTVTVEATSPMGTATMTLPMNLKQFKAAMAKWDNGAMVQEAFPTFNATQREFLMTGMSEAQQKAIFGSDDG